MSGLSLLTNLTYTHKRRKKKKNDVCIFFIFFKIRFFFNTQPK